MKKLLGVALLLLSTAASAQVIPQPGPPTPIGCAQNTVEPTLGNGQAGWVQCNNKGEVRVDGSSAVQPISGTVTANQGTAGVSPWPVTATQATSPWVDNVAQWAGQTLGAMANYGVSPGAVLVPGVNAFVTNIPAVSQSGAWTVTANAGTGNFTVVQPTASSLNATVIGTGTFATQAAQSGIWTIQPGNTANTTPWLSSISQGGNTATVSAGGALKVDSSAATQPVSGTVTANQGGAWSVTSLASSNIIGKVGIDQTTPGTTNAVVPVASAASPTDASGSITSGGTAQLVIGADVTRHGIQIQNQSADVLCFAYSSGATCGNAGTWELSATTTGVAGGSYTTPVGYPETSTVYIIGPNTGAKFTAVWW